MWSGRVVFGSELVDEVLQLGEGGGLGRLGAEPFLEGLLETFDFPLGLRVVGVPVLLGDVAAVEFVFEAVSSSFVFGRGEADGVDHAVVGEGRGGVAVLARRCPEAVEHEGCGDAVVGLDAQRVAGVVIEPGDDLGVPAGMPVARSHAGTDEDAIHEHPAMCRFLLPERGFDMPARRGLVSQRTGCVGRAMVERDSRGASLGTRGARSGAPGQRALALMALSALAAPPLLFRRGSSVLREPLPPIPDWS